MNPVRKTSPEFRVGIFVFFALAILIMLVFKAGDFYMKPGYTVRFIFDFVSGIDKGSAVRLAGVNVGEVSGIRVIRSAEGITQAEVMARIDQGIAVGEYESALPTTVLIFTVIASVIGSLAGLELALLLHEPFPVWIGALAGLLSSILTGLIVVVYHHTPAR